MLTDFHSHILPGIDDGSRSVEESIAMLRRCREQGIERIVLTPHFYANHSTPEQFLTERSDAYRRLMEALPAEEQPRLLLGAEVHYYPHMSHSEELRSMAIDGTSCILVEMPLGPWTDRMYRELSQLQSYQGLTPIIAHVDRYLGRFRDFGIPKRLSSLPVLVQANAEFFLDRRTAGKALRMLKNRQIHLLGSDCHDLTDRAPELGSAIGLIRRKLGEDAIEWLRSCEEELLTPEVTP